MMRIISRSDVERLLPITDCISVMHDAMCATSAGNVSLPIRQFMPIPDSQGKLALMPGTLGNPACFGIKLVCKYDRPHDDPLGSHVGMVILFDSKKGVPLAIIEGSSLTAIRTSAASALATDLLARKQSECLAILGNGEQAMRHIAAMQAVRPINEVRIWGRDIARATEFAARATVMAGIPVRAVARVDQAVNGADIICTTTSSTLPVLHGAQIDPGVHINLVGSAIATKAEIDIEGVMLGRFYVDYRPAALSAAGELLAAIEAGAVTEDHIVGEIGHVAAGDVDGRTGDAQITIYKSLGVASQDLAAGYALWQAAEVESLGLMVDLLA